MGDYPEALIPARQSLREVLGVLEEIRGLLRDWTQRCEIETEGDVASYVPKIEGFKPKGGKPSVRKKAKKVGK